ncbi:m-AAA protease-interacting protein 1, mitochondrial-like [Aricia agestis]|uniref:m-AAA protease-interacting protein 1, mitochondrial-like n=1 Tax=Aricia agestis TaxID=91739 RepID=UPI001C207FBC|nr:m-AAA protease-interacting protein 1, mitochondrial-like [Aricia agestis]
MYKHLTIPLNVPKISKYWTSGQDLKCLLSHQKPCICNAKSIQKEFSRNFHHFQPRRSSGVGVLLNLNSYSNNSRSFWSNPIKQEKKIPRLILLQNPWTWFMVKLDFTVLRNLWDPTFHEKEFKYGATQAIYRVTQVISEGQMTELNGLLTRAARFSLLRELDRNWPEKQRPLLALKGDDIQISTPRKVYFIRIADKKYCDVDMAFLALKWAPINSVEALIFAEIFARFHREYTPASIPEWTIAFFKIARFQVLRHSKNNNVKKPDQK